MHRGLKPENILMAKKEPMTMIKITDFGLSKFIDEASMLKTFCGTLGPEILLNAGSGTYTEVVALWSLGHSLHLFGVLIRHSAEITRIWS